MSADLRAGEQCGPHCAPRFPHLDSPPCASQHPHAVSQVPPAAINSIHVMHTASALAVAGFARLGRAKDKGHRAAGYAAAMPPGRTSTVSCQMPVCWVWFAHVSSARARIGTSLPRQICSGPLAAMPNDHHGPGDGVLGGGMRRRRDLIRMASSERRQHGVDIKTGYRGVLMSGWPLAWLAEPTALRPRQIGEWLTASSSTPPPLPSTRPPLAECCGAPLGTLIEAGPAGTRID